MQHGIEAEKLQTFRFLQESGKLLPACNTTYHNACLSNVNKELDDLKVELDNEIQTAARVSNDIPVYRPIYRAHVVLVTYMAVTAQRKN